MSEYQNVRLCKGKSNEKKPCKHISTCKLCVGGVYDEEHNRVFICGRKVEGCECIRDLKNGKK